MSQWDSSSAGSSGASGPDRPEHSDDLKSQRRKSLWEKRMEAARAQRARVLSGEMPATPRRVPPARVIAKDNGIKRKASLATPSSDSIVEPAQRPRRAASSLRVVLAETLAKARSAAAPLRPHMSEGYDRLERQLAHVATWRLAGSLNFKRMAGIALACGCSLALGYAIGNRSDGADPSQALAVGTVTESPLPVPEESRGPIIVGRLVEPEPDLMAVESVSQEPTAPEPSALAPDVPDAIEISVEEVALKAVLLSESEPLVPETPDILSDLSNIAWTSKIIVQPETVPDIRSALVSLRPAAPEVPPGGGPDEVVRLAGLPAQVGSLRMLVFAPASVRQSVLEENLNRLTSSGAEIAALQRVGMRISTAHIRYFFEEDAQAAIDLGDTLGIEARSFLHMSGSESGQVEVWLRGASLPARADPEPEPDPPQSFRDRFSGDYR